MSRIGDVMGEAHKNVQHVSLGQPGAPVAAIGKALSTLGDGIDKNNKLRQKAADKNKKQAKEDAMAQHQEAETKRRDELTAKIRPHLVGEVTRHVRRLNSASAGDATTVAQSQRLIAKFGSVEEYHKAISNHPEFKRHLRTVLSSGQFKAKNSLSQPSPSRVEYSGHASR